MPRSRKKLFEELGLLSEPKSEPNPYTVLGMSPSFAADLLKEDTSGEMLRSVTAGLAKVITRHFHPDVNKTGEQRFKDVHEAAKRISGAELADLERWAKAEVGSTPATTKQQQQQRESIAQRAAGLIGQNMALGLDSRHFSQLRWSQGVLLRQNKNTLLARQHPTGGLQVLRGEEFGLGKSNRPFVPSSQLLGFQAFMMQHESFGLEPDRNIVAYLDETGRASLLTSDLRFIMDVTDPVAAYFDLKDESAAWARANDPVLFSARVPGPQSLGSGEAKVWSFPGRSSGRDLTWNLPQLEVAGTVADQDFYRRIRYAKEAGTIAIKGSGGGSRHYFGMAAVPTRQFVEQEVGYTPLIDGGQSLLLFDSHNQVPIVTDARVIGMLGNGPQY